MEWTNDLIFEFLHLYQNEPSLWNASSPEHKNKNDAFDAWIRIKSNLKDGSIPIKEIKKKKDNLMSTYRRQRSKVLDSMAGDQVYKPEWPFYKVMATFLNDVYVPRKTKSSEDLLDTEDYEENTSIDDEKNHNIDKTERDYYSSSIKNVPKRKFKRSKLREEDIKIHIEEAFDLSKQMNQNSDIDESSLYCVLLCKKLRGLKERTREIAMMEIDKVIYNLKHQEKEMNKLSNGSYSMMNPQQPLQAPMSLQAQQYPPDSLSTLLLSHLAPLLQQSSQPSIHQQTPCPQSSPVDQKPSLMQSPGSSHSFHSP